ncbi:hypothetical protein [Chromobacterium violaceum]|uniref:hypothetical protein n=1 Tax=Chromobacterium violaceum TaxID=536 RepID=UPI00111C075B|nr:hypothetical protein [Chromobacterium violaceum]
MINENLKKEEISWARAAEIAKALYFVGFVTLIISATLILAFKQRSWFTAIFEVTCAVSFGLGFCMRVWPILVKSGRTPYGKGGMALFHAIVLVFSSILAKHIISGALSLPSGDFPVTLSMWALLSYPAVWLIGTAFLCLVAYAFFLLLRSHRININSPTTGCTNSPRCSISSHKFNFTSKN